MHTPVTSPARRLLGWLLYATAILPLIVWKGLVHPFETPREIVFRVLLAVIAPVAVFVWLREGMRRRLGIVGWSAGAVLLAGALSTAFSVDPSTSFWGFAERLTGFVTIALCVLFGAALRLLFRDPRARFRFLCAWLGAWGIVTAWAIIEFFSPGYWSQFHGGEQRVVASIGNPIFLAGGLTLAVSTASVALLSWKRLRYRGVLTSFVLVLGIAAIFFTQTRGAYIGLVAGALVFGATMAWWATDRRVRLWGLGVPLVVFLLVGVLFLFRETAAIRSFSPLYRAVSIFSLTTNDPSRIQRFQLWRVAINAVRARPMTGWGLENFDTALDRLYDPNITRYGVANSVSDRAHNAYLDVAATAGVPGLLAYTALLVSFGIAILRLRKQQVLTATAAAVALGGLVAYAVGNVTAFDTHVTYFGLVVAGAVLASLEQQKEETLLRPAVPVWLPALGVSSLSCCLIFFGVVPLARGAAAVHQAVVAEDGQQLLAAARTLLTFWNPYRAHEAQRIANEIFKAVGNDTSRGQGAQELLAAAEDLMRDAVARRPSHFSTRFTLANIVTLQATRGFRDPADAYAALEAARPLAPQRQITDFQEGNVLLVQKKPKEALEKFQHALALDTSVVESHWHVARGLVEAGERAEGAQEFGIAIRGGFGENRPGQEYALAINALVEQHDFASVYQLYAFWSLVEPTNANVFASLAVAAAEVGKQREAIAALRQAIRLDPTLAQEAPAFITTYHLPADALTTGE